MQEGSTIRRANESDVESAYRLIVALGYQHLARIDFERTFKAILAHPETRVLLAADESGQAIGLMTLSHRPQLRLAGTIVCIDELAVVDEARGRGVGRALLNRAKEIAIELSAERLELHTNRARESYTRQFYVKNGFAEANSALMRLEKTDFSK